MNVELITRYVKLLLFFVILWVLLWVYNNYGYRKIAGTEMEPEMNKDSFSLIQPKVRFPAQLRRDDVVAWNYTEGGWNQNEFAGRVVALPGDRVKMVKGTVEVNNAPIRDDSAATQRTSDDFEEIIVPRDTVFVLCNNRKVSEKLDSRGIGPISGWTIVGKLR